MAMTLKNTTKLFGCLFLHLFLVSNALSQSSSISYQIVEDLESKAEGLPSPTINDFVQFEGPWVVKSVEHDGALAPGQFGQSVGDVITFSQFENVVLIT